MNPDPVVNELDSLLDYITQKFKGIVDEFNRVGGLYHKTILDYEERRLAMEKDRHYIALRAQMAVIRAMRQELEERHRLRAKRVKERK